MRIFFVTPEALPCSRVGGLGDISYHLPKALTALGHQVTVLVPKYRMPQDFSLTPLPHLNQEIDLSISRRTAEFHELRLPGEHSIITVGCNDFFDRPGIYGNEFGDYDDNAERFIFFSKAAFAALRSLIDPAQPTVVHSHDWPTALLPMYFKVFSSKYPSISSTGTIFTYHNLANQGTFPYYDFTMTGLDWSYFTFQGLEFHGQLNLTKGGLLGAHLISTVSHSYAKETMGPEYGKGLEGLIKERRKDLRSVLHGVDYELWDPAKDRYLPANYCCDRMEGKKVCRDNLSALYGIDPGPEPIVAMVSRLLSRKGLDLIATAMPNLLELPLKLVFMGTGDDQYISFLRQIVQNNPGKVGLKLSYDPALTHQIIAGADIFLAPSRFEPCGLEQLYALKFGTVPVTRATGGLDDTVVDELTKPGEGTGFKFSDYSPPALLTALTTAINQFDDQDNWRKLMQRCMLKDYSWERSAQAYEDIYKQAIALASEPRDRHDAF
ncbi:MAG: glycogen synthase [Deltaproteobacteria bacterium]|jgi:starch synthase|nr:glycogen synthase [Deltaproteobacteria bacterium]